MYHGDIRLNETIDIKFTTVNTSGVPTTLAGTPVVSAYPGNSITELAAGITLTVDFDARTGLHNVRVVATGANGYATATNYALVITTGTVDGASVVGYVVGTFSIENRSALMPTTAARTLDVTATGEAGIDLDNTVGTLAKTTDITGFNDLSAAQVNAEVDSALDTAIPVTPTTGSINDKVKPLTFSTANQVDARVQSWLGVAPNALISGRVDASVGAMAANVVTAAAVATGAIDADALAADAATEIRSFANGTSDSGTTTTMVDAARTEADIDYWKGSWIAFTSGTLLGQVRLITAFDPVTDTITFAPATTVAVGTHTYEILPSARVDLQLWLGAVVNALIAGRVDANAQVVGDKTGYAIGVGGIGATAFAAGAIDAAAIAADAIGASEIANGAIDAATFAAGAIDAAAIATDAIGSAEFSQAAADKVFGGSGATLAELAQAAPPITPRPDQVLMLLYMALRNASKSTATERRILNDAGTIISKATMSDDGTTFDQGKLISGL